MEACLLISKSPTVKEHGVTNTFLYSCIALRCIETYYEEGTNGHPRVLKSRATIVTWNGNRDRIFRDLCGR